MAKIDQGKERQRLASLYAGRSDLELQKVDRNPESLTDWAFEGLRGEMHIRGLDRSGKDMPFSPRSRILNLSNTRDDGVSFVTHCLSFR